MRRTLLIAAVVLLASATPLFAHRIDEYLQATTMQVSRARLRMDMRLVPGIAVVSSVIDSIDTNHDGAISTAEEEHYGNAVLNDVSVSLDNAVLPLSLVSAQVGAVEEMRQGMGEIRLAFAANLPEGGERRHLVFENRHRRPIAVYLVNGLVPEEQGVHITKHTRNYLQSVYEMEFDTGVQGGASLSIASVLKWMVLVAGGVFILREGLLAARRRRQNREVNLSSR